MKKQFSRVSEEEMAVASTHQKRNVSKFPYSLGDLDRHANVSMYYGFTPIKEPPVSKEDLVRVKGVAARLESAGTQRLPFAPEERVALLRSFLENDMNSFSQPVMVYYKKRPEAAKRLREIRVALDVVGTGKAIGEALVISAALAILHDQGYKNVAVELNSVGDKDAMAKHDKELNLYLRKHAHAIHPKFKVQLKACPHALLHIGDAEEEGVKTLRDNAPKSVSCLPESARRHLMELLEFLEILEVPYRINHALLGHRGVSNHVIFQIRDALDEARPALAYGFRYNVLSQKAGFRKEIPAVGVNISFEKIYSSKLNGSKSDWKPIAAPKFYFIQFGGTARLKSLKLIEMLRREGISVYHSLTRDKLVGQITAAESLKVPYLLIMGQKEALEDSIVVRNLNTRAQETVYLRDLVSYLKKLK